MMWENIALHCIGTKESNDISYTAKNEVHQRSSSRHTLGPFMLSHPFIS
jgi:hypothetical protein